MPVRRPLLKACLNGARPAGGIVGLPVTPSEVAQDAAAARAAGAAAVHVHPRDSKGRERLDAATIGATVSAIRELVPGLPIGVSTGDWIEPDARAHIELVRSWDVLPDFASVNLHEEGAIALAEVLIERSVGIEAGVWTVEAAEVFVGSAIASRCLRVLIEPRASAAAEALRTADAIRAVLDRARNTAPRLLHGTREGAWDVLRAALDAGLDLRIGLEDTSTLPDGSQARSNAELIVAAVGLIEGRS
ncbi:MAG: hypothetical protein DWG80_03745 [Chloroflexi bacterium]|nr:hypothetical protein [Chloroflexota bacterium]